MVASIGAIASAAQGVSYYEKDGYYAKDDAEHREASAWAGKGADALGLTGPVDPDVFRAVLEGKVPDGSGRELGRRDRDGKLLHRPGRDVTLSAPKSVSLVGLVGGDVRVVDVHDRAVEATLVWIEGNAAETRVKDPATGRMGREGGQKMVAATFRHDTSRNLDPQLHTHVVIANMVQGEDGKWRSMANEKLYESKMLIGAIYRSELARGLGRLGYGIEKTHADGRFEIAGVSREAIDAFSTRRAEIEAGMAERGMGYPGRQSAPRRAGGAGEPRGEARHRPRRAHRRLAAPGGRSRLRRPRAHGASGGEGRGAGGRRPGGSFVGCGGAGYRAAWREPRWEPDGAAANPCCEGGAQTWRRPGRDRALGEHSRNRPRHGRWNGPSRISPNARRVFSRTDLLTAALAWDPGEVTVGEAEDAAARLEGAGSLHGARLPGMDGLLTTDRAVGDERETIALMEAGRERGATRDARPRRRQGAAQGAADGRPEGGGEADPLRRGPRGRRPGLCRKRQDHDVEPRPRAPGEARLRGPGARALGLGRAHPRRRGRDRCRDPAALPRALRRGRGGTDDREGRKGNARGVREDRAGGRRGLARLHRPGPRPSQDRRQLAHAPRGAGGRRETARRGRRRQALRAAPGRRYEDRGDGPDHAPARSGAEGSRRGEPRGRYRPRLREAGRQRGRSESRQSRGRRRGALARAARPRRASGRG